ncbi:MAG TPA: hypothetical protein VN541_04540 [Tepidisphaeraceae bacterium]|nr:hypothetical protein [Tepidisphaeraceae bacterium]
MDVWFEGVQSDPNVTVTLTVKDSSGNQITSDSIHLNVADFSFVDPHGSPIYQINPIWTDALNAAENADTSQFSFNTDPTQWAVPDDAAEVQLQGVCDPSSATISEFPMEDPGSASPDTMNVSGQDMTSAEPIVMADDDAVAAPTSQPSPLSVVNLPNLNVRTVFGGKAGLGVKVDLGPFDRFFRTLAVQKLTITLDNNNGLFAPGDNVGYTVSIVNPAANANYQIVTDVQGNWSQITGASNHFSAANIKAPPTGVDGIFAYVFTGPNAAQQANQFIQASQNGSPAPFYGQYFATASTAFYVGDAATEGNAWFKQAWASLINNNPTSGNPISRNRLITQNYVTMYNTNPLWAKWSGMAAFASYDVGSGIAGATVLNLIFPKNPITGEVPIYEALQEGNFGIFADVYPQFLAYQGGGLAAIQAMGALVDQQTQLPGWQQIDAGVSANGGPNLNGIWSGNQLLLQYEQQTIAQQKLYNPYPKLWASVSAYAPTVLGFQLAPPGSILASPIPGNGWSFAAVVQPQLQQGQQLSIADYNQRWLWVTDPNHGMLLTYEAWAGNNNAVDFNKLMSGGYL